MQVIFKTKEDIRADLVMDLADGVNEREAIWDALYAIRGSYGTPHEDCIMIILGWLIEVVNHGRS